MTPTTATATTATRTTAIGTTAGAATATAETSVSESAGAETRGCELSRHAVFAECPQCGGAMEPEHAHYRCTTCGWRDSCCD